MKNSQRIAQATEQQKRLVINRSALLWLEQSCRQFTYRATGGNRLPMKLFGADVIVREHPEACQCGKKPEELADGMWLECVCAEKAEAKRLADKLAAQMEQQIHADFMARIREGTRTE